MSASVSLRQGVGRAIRAARLHEGRTADEFAAAARLLGLRWQRATVSMIEAGRRALTAEELLMLPVLFAGRVSLADLLADRMSLTREVEVTPEGFAEILRGESPTVGRGFVLPSTVITTFGYTLASTPGWGRGSGVSEADYRAARRLRVEPEHVAFIARRMFGRGFTEERDARSRADVGESAGPEALRAARRRASIQLVAEMRPAVSAELVVIKRGRAIHGKH